MKKNLIAIMLVLAMALSLAACGSSANDTKGDAQQPQSESHPEFVYAAKFEDFIKDSKNYVNPRVFNADGGFATVWEKVGENIPEGEVPEYEGQYDVYQNSLYFIGFDGTMKKLDDYKPVEGPANENGYSNFTTNSYVEGLLASNDGKLYVIENLYSSWYDGPANVARYSDDYWDNMHYEQQYYIRKLDTDGSEISRGSIEVPEGSYLNAYNAQLDSKGNILLTTENFVRAIDENGSDAYIVDCVDYIDTLVKLGDGRVAVSVWGDNGAEIRIIDSDNKTLGESYPLKFSVYNSVPGTDGYDLYYNSGTNFYGVKLAEGVQDKIFNWLSCDINGESIGQLFIEEDGSITGFMNEWSNRNETYNCQRVTISKQPYDSVPHKETITMAAVSLDYDILNKIVAFNRKNDKVRIEVSDYSEYNNDEAGWDAGTTKLNTEIMAGNVPDIFSLNGLNYTQLASKGILEDLYPYIDADSELNRDDFFPNVLGAMEVGGKLYSTVPSFYVNSVIGAASVVGDKPGWTYDELNAALASMPEGCTVFDSYVTKNDILSNCLALDMDEFVDWGSGKCNFDSEQFVALLNFVNGFPSEYDWNNFNMEGENTTDRIAQGRQMLMQSALYSVEDIFYSNNEQYFGGKICYIGYPTLHGTGNMIGFSSSGIAMSSKAQHKDEIWKFMREFFTEDYQYDSWSLPSNRKVFDAKLKDACTIQYEKDGNGNYRLDENGEKIPIVRYSAWSNDEGKVVDYYCMSEEQAAQIVELVTTTTKVANYDNSIFEIVTEQAQAFFEGQRSAQDVAKLIQSKANIFVNEQR